MISKDIEVPKIQL